MSTRKRSRDLYLVSRLATRKRRRDAFPWPALLPELQVLIRERIPTTSARIFLRMTCRTEAALPLKEGSPLLLRALLEEHDEDMFDRWWPLPMDGDLCCQRTMYVPTREPSHRLHGTVEEINQRLSTLDVRERNTCRRLYEKIRPLKAWYPTMRQWLMHTTARYCDMLLALKRNIGTKDRDPTKKIHFRLMITPNNELVLEAHLANADEPVVPFPSLQTAIQHMRSFICKTVRQSELINKAL